MWRVSGSYCSCAKSYGPTRSQRSGILIQETPGFILTEKRILTRRVFVSLDPKISIEKAYNISSMQLPELQTWYQMHLQRAQDRVRNILEQARKPFVSSSIPMSNRPKRFLTAIIVALVCATVGAVVATGMSAANSITVQKLDMEIYALKQHINDIHQVVNQQRTLLQDVLTIVEDTVVTTNLHSELITKSTELHQSHDLFKRELLFLHDPILFHTLAFLDEVQTGMIEFAGGHIPLYFVSKDIVHAMLASVDGETIEPMQLNLDFEMGSAIPLLIDPERMEICFLLAIPYVTLKDIFQMKTMYYDNNDIMVDCTKCKVQNFYRYKYIQKCSFHARAYVRNDVITQYVW
ncbi:Hypothetical predicted protein [Pelobates cultripes]|uniref:Uncharacterized protein n=1 Tax=Pelobates cultripes TaxID=61616 RepID=A0AAD1WHU6_PELCU|nr:Hypothetical predicted protein [Pelobates cultripes]